MKTNVKIILAVLAMLILSVSAFAGVVTTSQAWSFDNDSNPSSPDAGFMNVYGAADANATVGEMGSGWWDSDSMVFGSEQGFWDIGGTDGSIVLSVPFTTSIILGSETISLEYVYYKEPSGEAVLTIENGSLKSFEESLIESVGGGGAWYKYSSVWALDSNLSSPYLSISLVGSDFGSIISQINVYTSANVSDVSAVPEPATLLGLVSFIPGAFIAFRKRK